MGIIDGSELLPQYFLPNQSLFWRGNDCAAAVVADVAIAATDAETIAGAACTVGDQGIDVCAARTADVNVLDSMHVHSSF